MKKQLYAIFALHSLEGFASSLVGIFIPIYLLVLGYSLSQVLIFCIISALAVFFFFICSAYLSAHAGIKSSFILRLPVLIIFYVLLFSLDTVRVPLSLLAVLAGSQAGLYWYPLHVLFSKNSDTKKLGKEIGMFFSFPQILSVAGPFIGGLVSYFGGFKLLFLATMVFHSLTLFPLYLIDNLDPQFDLKFKSYKKLFKRYASYFYAEVFCNIAGEVEGVIWPIFIFITLKNTVSVGAIGTLLGIGGAVFTMIAGKYADKKDRKLMLKTGALLLAVIWVLRYFTVNEFSVYILTILAGFIGVLVMVPFSAIFYKLSKKHVADDFFIFREIPITLGRIIIYSIALLFAGAIKSNFLIAAVSYVYFLIY